MHKQLKPVLITPTGNDITIRNGKMLNIKSITISALFSLSLLASSYANAAIVQFSVNGEITRAAADNYFNLVAGDIVTVTGVYDDSVVVASGESIIDFSSLSGNYFNFEFGNTTYNSADDFDNLATMYLFDGLFDGIDYISPDFKLHSYGYVGGYEWYEDFTAKNDTIAGNWIVDSFQVTAVPVPAAVWLFATGLIFLSGIARRKPNA